LAAFISAAKPRMMFHPHPRFAKSDQFRIVSTDPLAQPSQASLEGTFRQLGLSSEK